MLSPLGFTLKQIYRGEAQNPRPVHKNADILRNWYMYCGDTGPPGTEPGRIGRFLVISDTVSPRFFKNRLAEEEGTGQNH